MRKSYGNKEDFNEYYQNLLANQPEPDHHATDDRARAIRYAKDHFECYYEVKDIAHIIGLLNKTEEKGSHADMTTLLKCVRSPSPSPHETSGL